MIKKYGKSEPRIAMLVPDNALKEPKIVTPRLVGDRAEIELQSQRLISETIWHSTEAKKKLQTKKLEDQAKATT